MKWSEGVSCYSVTELDSCEAKPQAVLTTASFANSFLHLGHPIVTASCLFTANTSKMGNRSWRITYPAWTLISCVLPLSCQNVLQDRKRLSTIHSPSLDLYLPFSKIHMIYIKGKRTLWLSNIEEQRGEKRMQFLFKNNVATTSERFPKPSMNDLFYSSGRLHLLVYNLCSKLLGKICNYKITTLLCSMEKNHLEETSMKV